MGYQTLHSYSGTLQDRYGGIEFDPQIPANVVMGSPGGVASSVHDWTGGFYGKGGSSWDNYAGQGYRYPYAEHANLYQYGQSAPNELGIYTQPPDPMYTQNMGEHVRDNFEYIPVEPEMDPKNKFLKPRNKKLEPLHDIKMTPVPEEKDSKNASPFIILIIIIILYVSLDFLSSGTRGFVTSYINEGKRLSWKQLLLCGFVAMIFLIAIMYYFPINIKN